MWRFFLAGAIAVSLAASALHARQGVVTTKDKRQITGDINQLDNGDIVLKDSHNIEMKIERKNIESIEYIGSVEDQFTSRLAKLTSTDVSGRIEVARFAFTNHRYDLARKALDEALKIDPASKAVTDLQDLIDRTEILERKTTRKQSATTTTGPRSPIIEKKVLSADDINLIRQLEIGPGETQATIRFEHDVRKQFLARSTDTVDQFNKLTPLEQARRIFTLNDAALNRSVRMQSNPQTMQDFKLRIQPIVLASCATANCHGGEKGANLILYSGNDAVVEARWFTNFYLLQTYSRTIEKTKYLMIDRSTPQNSLLLQYGLTPPLSVVKHPGASDYKPPFTGAEDKKYQAIYDWIRSLNLPEPDYAIQFPLASAPSAELPPLPTSKPTSRPATQRAIPSTLPDTAPAH